MLSDKVGDKGSIFVLVILGKNDMMTASGRSWMTRKMPWDSEVYPNYIIPVMDGQRFWFFQFSLSCKINFY